jgi:hypothetical protein
VGCKSADTSSAPRTFNSVQSRQMICLCGLIVHLIVADRAFALVNMCHRAEDLARKVKKSYCPPAIVEGNPVLDYCKHIIFGYFNEVRQFQHARMHAAVLPYALFNPVACVNPALINVHCLRTHLMHVNHR